MWPADWDQPVHPASMARVLVYSSLDSLEVVEGTCDQRRLIRLRWCADWSASSLVAQVVGFVTCWHIYQISRRTAFPTGLRMRTAKTQISLHGCRNLDPRLPREYPAKTQIRLYGCAGWSESLLGAHAVFREMLCSLVILTVETICTVLEEIVYISGL